MNVKWLISSYMLDRQPSCGFPSLFDAAKEAGFDAAIDDVPFLWWTEHGKISDFGDYTGKSLCLVGHGPKQFVTKNMNLYFTPGFYAQSDKHAYSGFSPYYGKYMLNSDFILLPFAEIVRRRPKNLRWNGEIFIRPNSTSKIFTGQVLTEENFDFEVNSLNQLSGVTNETLCVVSSAVDIDAEFRFLIVDHEVITGSEYRWDNVLDIRSDVQPEAQAMAETIAKQEWQPDRVFICDIAMHNGKAYLLEINPFSSSGLYAMDTRKIVQAVSKAAWSEYTGDDI